jgi:hypothetical protein
MEAKVVSRALFFPSAGMRGLLSGMVELSVQHSCGADKGRPETARAEGVLQPPSSKMPVLFRPGGVSF